MKGTIEVENGLDVVIGQADKITLAVFVDALAQDNTITENDLAVVQDAVEERCELIERKTIQQESVIDNKPELSGKHHRDNSLNVPANKILKICHILADFTGVRLTVGRNDENRHHS